MNEMCSLGCLDHVSPLSLCLSSPPGPPLNSGQPKGVFGEPFDAKGKLTCPICLKEFKSLPALNGHMRSHGGMRASPSLKQVSRRRPPRFPGHVLLALLCQYQTRRTEGHKTRGQVSKPLFPGLVDESQKQMLEILLGIPVYLPEKTG